MRINIEIPESLIEEAMKLSDAKTISELIKEALEEKINVIRRKRLVTFKGSIELDIDLNNLRDRK
ncbi:type II toxin-antitoxin system VapB family antitoxin [Aquiflexum lacus]|uniref:type II toxin-antitoxin system VapB family antitoxin n=1 Tax=Aquiflexum lacus TaxID=2483805 RepID=UPI00189525F9|nr:type II toxin-antitoxin system VapB family antitoxin [Aquiflexum lacus]